MDELKSTTRKHIDSVDETSRPVATGVGAVVGGAAGGIAGGVAAGAAAGGMTGPVAAAVARASSGTVPSTRLVTRGSV